MKFEKPNWRIALFSSFFLVMFCALSVWQYERGQEKIELIALTEEKANLQGERLTPDLAVVNGDPIRARGSFKSDKIFLLDNRVLNGRVGYEVVQLFEDSSGIGVLVNRGFLAGQLKRSELPVIPQPISVPQSIRGHAYLTEMQVPAANLSGEGSPWVIQVVKPNDMEAIAEVSLFSHVIRLEEGHPDALPRYWPVTIMSPERHFGYAFTWLIMAIAVLMAFVYSMRVESLEQ